MTSFIMDRPPTLQIVFRKRCGDTELDGGICEIPNGDQDCCRLMTTV